MKVYDRTENGTTTRIPVAEGLAEINHAMTGGRRSVRTMSSITRTDYAIEYKDGRKVRLVQVEVEEPAEVPAETDSKGRRIVAAKGKRYVVGTVIPARPRNPSIPSWTPRAYVHYWSERNGETFGATRFAFGDAKPGTVARAIWDAVNR